MRDYVENYGKKQEASKPPPTTQTKAHKTMSQRSSEMDLIGQSAHLEVGQVPAYSVAACTHGCPLDLDPRRRL